MRKDSVKLSKRRSGIMQRLGPSQNRTKISDITMCQRKQQNVDLDEAARIVGTTKDGLRGSMRSLGVKLYKFPLDPRSYIKREDAAH
jgi:hypothetical protein